MPRTAKVFMTNRSQAVRLPKEYQFSTDEVSIRKEGEDVILSPRPRNWRSYLATAPAASDTFMNGVEDLPVQERESSMPRYMLDTGRCSYIIKRSHPLVLKRLPSGPVSDARPRLAVFGRSRLLI